MTPKISSFVFLYTVLPLRCFKNVNGHDSFYQVAAELAAKAEEELKKKGKKGKKEKKEKGKSKKKGNETEEKKPKKKDEASHRK